LKDLEAAIKNASMAIRVTDPLSGWKHVFLLAGCVLSVVALLALENYVGRDIPLGGLYLLPLIVAAGYVPRWATFLTAIATALAREQFGPYDFAGPAPQRLALTMVAFTGGALFGIAVGSLTALLFKRLQPQFEV